MRMPILAADLAPISGSVIALAPTSGSVIALTLPKATHPAAVYLASLAVGSRRAMGQALTVLRNLLAPGSAIAQVPWHLVRYEHAMALRARLSETYAPATANKILAALRGVLRAAFGLGLASADDLQRVLATKGVRGTRVRTGRAIGRVELEKLFDACSAETAAGARDAALLAILYGGGLRRSEVVGLDLADFDVREETLRVQGKGNKHRVMFATCATRRALAAWIGVRGDWPGPLFCPVTKVDTILARRLSSQAVLDLVGRLADRAGLAHVSPHDFRRTFVGDLLDAGADLATVQRLAGHASPDTTSRYDRRDDRARRRAAELLHIPFGRSLTSASHGDSAMVPDTQPCAYPIAALHAELRRPYRRP